MKLFSLITIFFLLISCERIEKIEGEYKTIVIDNCQYIEYRQGVFDNSVYGITHKGNCKFCLDRQKQ